MLTLLLSLSLFTPQSETTHRVLAQDKGFVYILGKDGSVEWQYPVKCTAHDLHMLPSGNVLLQTTYTTIEEVNKDKKVVWKYESKPKPGYTGKIEVHAFQRLPGGNTMIAESGNGRIIEVDASGAIVKEFPLTLDKPHFHRDTRLARKLETGHYLVCHEGDGKVREYDDKGKVVWTYQLQLVGERKGGHDGHGTEVYGAIRLGNGNTLIATGNGNRVIEVNKEGKVLWSVGQKELPGITLTWVTTLQELPNGNIVIGNCHAGDKQPQLVEVNREKKVIWTLNNHKQLGNDTAMAQILDVANVNR